jgi:hypothetical protein
MTNGTRLREFTWAGMNFAHRVPTGGFSWRVDLVRNHEQPGSPLPGNERGPWLTAAGYSGPHCGGEEYRLDAPLRRSRSDIGLHRDFASLAPVAILAFANQHGPLGHGEMLVDPAGSFEQDYPYGESFEFWRRQIQKMAALVRTWDLARREETGILTHLVKWTRPGERADGPVRVEVTIPPWEPWWTEAPVPWRFDSILDPARAIVVLHLNRVLRETTAPQVLMPEGKPTLQNVPQSLLGALYVSLAHELAGVTHAAEQCPNWRDPRCGKHNINGWFVPKTTKQGYCSNACRNTVWRREKKT